MHVCGREEKVQAMVAKGHGGGRRVAGVQVQATPVGSPWRMQGTVCSKAQTCARQRGYLLLLQSNQPVQSSNLNWGIEGGRGS